MAREFYLAIPAGNGFYLERVEEQPVVGGAILHEQVESSLGFGLTSIVSLPLGVDFDAYYFIVANWYLGDGNTAILDGFTFGTDSNNETLLFVHLSGGVTGANGYVSVIGLSKELF